MGQRDIQALIGVVDAGNIAVTTAAVPESQALTTGIDTQGMRAIMFVFNFSSVLTAADEIKLEITESDTLGGTYTTVPTAKMLPSRRETTQLASVTGPTSPYLQTIGAHGTKKFVKAQLTTAVMAADEDADVFMLFEDEFDPIERWDPDYTSVDGNP